MHLERVQCFRPLLQHFYDKMSKEEYFLEMAFEEYYGDCKVFNSHLHGLGIMRKTWQEWVWKHI